MKRYLIIFISQGEFCTYVIPDAIGLCDAVNQFVKSGMEHDEVYSVARLA